MNPLANPSDELAALDPSPLVFPRDKSTPHAFGCYAAGAVFVWPDGSTAPLRSKASNRCPGCARAAAFEAMTMLRIDAETNCAPGYVLTLTSRDPVTDAAAYRRACSQFWRAFRKRFGHVEYCGFVEWTTGKAASSGGRRRLHSHWLVKAGVELDAAEVEAWVSAEWARLTGAWVVQFARLETVGGVVGYLALHHEKFEQAPPAGWTGRRLRPSQGYFAVSGREIRARARLWLAEYRETKQRGELARPFGNEGSPRLVWRTSEWEKDARAIAATPGAALHEAPLPLRVALDRAHERRLLDADAPMNVDHLSALAQDEAYHALVVRAHYRRKLEERKAEARARRQPDGTSGASPAA